MRFLFSFLLAGCSVTSHPPPCETCNPQQCPPPSDVIPSTSCSVSPLVCPATCGMKCQCWPDDAGAAVWVKTTECEGGTDATTDATDASEAGDAGEAGDAASDVGAD